MEEPELLEKEYPKYKNILIEKFWLNYQHCYNVYKYNEWLFKLAFKDVLEEGKGNH
jgi:hypothetical protein